MAIVTNTYTTRDAIGIREDLTNQIYNVSPRKTPFLSMIGKTVAKNTLHEHQTDSLAAAANNAQVEGDEYTFDAITPTVRIGNYTQISRKTAIVSGTHMASDVAGRNNDMALALANKTAELKRDMETALLGNIAKSNGSSSTARKLGGVETWISTNTSRGTSGADPSSGGSAPTDGTARAITETLLKSVIQSCFDSGGEPDVLMVGSFNKQGVSGFTGRTQARQMIGAGKIQAAADLYASDFGDFKVIPNRFQRSRSALVLDPDYWKVAYYRPFKTEEVARTGDAFKRAILVEYTLQACNEQSSGIIADLTVT